jgi:uncharacterized membrane protein YgdD (TMEM256/DUF423 family)
MVGAVLWAVAVIFGAGAAWKTLKDMKGVSGKVNRNAQTENAHYLALCIVVLQALPEKDRAAWAAILYKGMN